MANGGIAIYEKPVPEHASQGSEWKWAYWVPHRHSPYVDFYFLGTGSNSGWHDNQELTTLHLVVGTHELLWQDTNIAFLRLTLLPAHKIVAVDFCAANPSLASQSRHFAGFEFRLGRKCLRAFECPNGHDNLTLFYHISMTDDVDGHFVLGGWES